MNLSILALLCFVRPVHRRQARVQLILQVALGPSAGFYLVLLGTAHSTSSLKREKAIQQRLDNKLEAAAADHLTPPRLKTLKPISGRMGEKKNHDPSSDITDF